MKLQDKTYFEPFNQVIGNKISTYVNAFDFSDSNSTLSYQTQASAVYSANIEGNSIDLNSFMNYKFLKAKPTPKKDLQEIEDLIKAYEFAQAENLNEKNLLKAHKIIAKHVVIASLRGKYRNDKVGVFGQAGLVYLAVEALLVENLMKAFFKEIINLLNQSLSCEEAFYFASLIHIRFVHIHPFSDGNGRAARLLEKWFLATTLGVNFWKIPSEKYYKDNQQAYYNNINLGVNFYELNYAKCINFLAMLPNCLR